MKKTLRKTCLSSFGLGLTALAMLLCLPGIASAQMEANKAIGESEVAPAEGDEAESTVKAPEVAADLRGVETYWGDPNIIEVEKGFYLNSKIGGNMFLVGPLGKQTKPGMVTGFGLGGDIPTLEKIMSLGLDFTGTINGENGAFDSAGTPAPDAKIAGDALMFQITPNVHLRYYTTKRIEAYIDLLGGVVFNQSAADGVQDVGGVTKFKKGQTMDYLGGGRLGVEYYTGLRHFSVGIEAGATYIITAASLGLQVNPTLKYTF